MSSRIVCLSEASEILTFERKALGRLVDRLGITVKPVPRVPHARGVSLEDVELIRQRLAPLKEHAVSVPA